MAELLPGKYYGKVTDSAIGKTKAGLPQVVLMFEFQDDQGNVHNRLWFGTLKEGKGRQITLNALLTCGFKGDDLMALNDGPACLDTEKLVELKVELGQPDSNGKRWANISWISTPGENSGGPNKLDNAEAQAMLTALPSLKAELMECRQQRDARYASKEQPAPAPLASSEIPF